MNERIKELAHNAGLPTYNPEGIPTKLEKFAEMIIKECGEIAAFGDPQYSAQHNILKHFGVN